MPSECSARPLSSPDFRAALLLVGLAFAAAGCGRSGPEESPAGKPLPANHAAAPSATPGEDPSQPRPGHLLGTDSAPDVRTLLDSVAARLRRRDTVGLVRLMINDSAWRRHIFPASSAFDTSSEDAFRFVLAMHKANSAKGLRRVLNDAVRQDSTPAPLQRSLDSTRVPGGTIYQVRPGDGLRPFGTALCIGRACRIATFAQPGAVRAGDRRPPAGTLPAADPSAGG